MKSDPRGRIKTISTKHMSRDDWLLQRRKTIGGSDAAAVIGLSPWASPYTVWADKTGRLPDRPDNEAMRIGRDLEEYVARRWCEFTGKKVRRSNQMIYNSLYPFAHADIDRLVVGESAGLECKTTSTLDLKQFSGVEFPEKYYVQCVHYLAVTGLDRWYLAVLVFGRGFFTFTLERDQKEIDALMAAEREFMERVEKDDPPPPDGKGATTEAIQTLYAESRGEARDLFGREQVLGEYLALKRQSKAIAERMDEIANTIKTEMETAERGSAGPYDVIWKTQSRRSFQPKAFARAYPGIDLAPFYQTSTARPFRVEERKSDIDI
ncbi:MAG: exonuclease [Chaetfec virus UA24_244]|nr:MAG: exonuclease [Chaetfec virus UA24_244]